MGVVSQVAQLVKNLPASSGDETQVQSLGQENPLEKGMAARFSVLAWKIALDGGARRAVDHGVGRVRHD